MMNTQDTERSLQSLAEEAVRLGRELEREARAVVAGGTATSHAFLARSLQCLAARDPFNERDTASFDALIGILSADLETEIVGTERRFVETYFDAAGQHGEMRDAPVYSERGERLLRVRDLLSAFLKARASTLDAIAAETALTRLLRT